MNFDDLLAALPACPGPSNAPLSTPTPAFRYHSTGALDFVGPTLSERGDTKMSATPDILVISAPGAVGKSTLARELAYRKGAPLLDLAEEDTVGAHSVLGRLTSSFGSYSYSTALSQGKLFLVIDALDEGRLKANETGFTAFLKDLAMLAGQKGCCKAVLLGRTHVAEAAWLQLTDLKVDVNIITIDPFSDQQAAEYVDLRMKRIGGSGAATAAVHIEKYRETRDAIFSQLRSAFAGLGNLTLDHEARGFLGYAPVLDAVATLLAKESNFGAVLEELRRGDSHVQIKAIGLLAKIVERILTREQDEKVSKNIQPVLASVAAQRQWGDWGALYSQTEQCARLLAVVLKTDAPKFHSEVPAEIVSAYEERLKPFVNEHPFLRDASVPANTVFEAYLFAKALVHNVGGFREDVELKMLDVGYKPSRLLADFYRLLLGERNVGVPPAHIGLLHEALQAGESPAQHLRVTIEGLDPEDADANKPGVAECEFEYIDEAGESRASWQLEVDIKSSSEFSFRRYLRDASVIVPCTVALGDGGKEFEVGPAVRVRCAKLRIPSDALVVGGVTRIHSVEEASAVVLESLAFESGITARPKVHAVGFQVAWPGAERFPWTEFRIAGSAQAGTDLHEAYRRFRRIVMTLRSHSKGSLARFKAKIEHQRVLQGPLGQDLLDKLKKDGVLRLDGNMYRLEPKPADEHVGTSWHDLKTGIASDRLERYLKDFLASRAIPT
jgi:hypothetical protein